MAEGDMDQRDDHPEERPKTRSRQGVLTFTSSGKLQTSRPKTPKSQDREQLIRVSKETLEVLPGLLLTRPDARPNGFLYEKKNVTAIDQKFCCHLPKTKVRVINSDTIDAALQMTRATSAMPVCVLNMANALRSGGGFRSGALAQEEALCYRTSLYLTLKIRFYPIPDEAAIYSPNVLVIRDSLSNGHALLDCRDPSQLSVISVVSVAAVYRPSVRTNRPKAHTVYTDPQDREMMREKMRIILRTAIRNKHRQIVLGALGCGAFENPPYEVCRLWRDVLQEPEFSGGWWEDVVFAVLSKGKADNNFNEFHQVLDGLQV